MVWWETDGRNRYMYETVLVLREDVERGALIREEMLTSIRMDKHLMIVDSVIDPQSIIGREAKHYLPAGTQLHSRYFEHPGLVTGEDTFIVKIPQEWLYSVPDTLRRKDQIVFFEVTRDVLERAYASRQSAALPEPSSLDIKLPGAVQEEHNNNALHTYRHPDAYGLIAMSSEPIYRTTAAYVKDGANREVVTVGPEERLDGSSLINSIEIPLTAEDKSRLEQAVARGSKFLVAYTEGADW